MKDIYLLLISLGVTFLLIYIVYSIARDVYNFIDKHRKKKIPKGIPDCENIPDPPRLKFVGIDNNFQARILMLERNIWELKNPPKFKLLDKVMFEVTNKKHELYGTFVVIAINEANEGSTANPNWKRRYTVMNKKTKAERTCVHGHILSKV